MGKIKKIHVYRCSSSCSTEHGYTCPTAGSACETVCGDGIYISGELCEDGDTADGDGCSSTCTVESGWKCTHNGGYSIDTCSTVCGDGLIKGSETCDDNNTSSGDGYRFIM